MTIFWDVLEFQSFGRLRDGTELGLVELSLSGFLSAVTSFA